MERKRGEAGGRQPETTTGFEYERFERSLFGSFRICRCGMLVDPGVSQIEHFDDQRQIFASERCGVFPLVAFLVQS